METQQHIHSFLSTIPILIAHIFDLEHQDPLENKTLQE